MDINQFLNSQLEVGEVQSEGEFTISLDKARKKLAEFQLTDPHFYILKIIQAAVACGSGRVDVKLKRSGVAVHFATASPAFSEKSLMDALANPAGATPGTLECLAIGINSSLVGDPQEVTFAWWDGNTGRAVQVKDDVMSIVQVPDQPDNPEGIFLCRFEIVKTGGSWFRSASSDEHAILTTHCQFAAVEIYLDGRALDKTPPKIAAGLGMSDLTEPFHLVERVKPDPAGTLKMELPALKRRGRGRSGWLRTGKKTSTFCVQPHLDQSNRKPNSSAYYSLPVGLNGVDTIHLVRHGVRVETIMDHHIGAGATAIMPADHLTFDLSGFKVQRNEAFQELLQVAKQEWLEMLDQVGPDLRALRAINS